MFFYEGQACPVCGEHFGENDDVVACPVCGAPHHRECWKREGHCHFAADHGTERQWAKEKSVPKTESAPTRACPNCGSKNPEFAEFCSHCGREMESADWHSAYTPPHQVHQYTPPTYGHGTSFRPPFGDPFGGVPRTERIEDVSVETVAQIVGQNSAYYLPRFFQMTRSGKKASWNWAAFLFPYNWLLYRKNILWGVLCFVFATVLEVFSSFAAWRVQNVATHPLSTETLQLYACIVLIAATATLALSLCLGFFGNYLYLQQVLRKARKLQEDPELQYNQNFSATGGTSAAAAVAPELFMFFAQYVFLLFTMF